MRTHRAVAPARGIAPAFSAKTSMPLGRRARLPCEPSRRYSRPFLVLFSGLLQARGDARHCPAPLATRLRRLGAPRRPRHQSGRRPPRRRCGGAELLGHPRKNEHFDCAELLMLHSGQERFRPRLALLDDPASPRSKSPRGWPAVGPSSGASRCNAPPRSVSHSSIAALASRAISSSDFRSRRQRSSFSGGWLAKPAELGAMRLDGIGAPSPRAAKTLLISRRGPVGS